MQTITDIAKHRSIPDKSARVAVRRAYEKLGEAMPKETTNETPLPKNILALIQNKGAKIGKVNGSAVVEQEVDLVQEPLTPEQYKAEIDKELSNARNAGEYQKALQSEIKPAVESEVKTKAEQAREGLLDKILSLDEIKPIQLDKPMAEKKKAKPAPIEPTDLLETVLNKKLTVLIALGVCIAVDGYCSGLVSEREIDTPGAFWVFGVLGVVFGFASIYNVYRLSRKERKAWESNPTSGWILAFAVFQFMLHGSAFQLFSDWSYLSTQQIISRMLLCVITPLASSALLVTLFAHKKN